MPPKLSKIPNNRRSGRLNNKNASDFSRICTQPSSETIEVIDGPSGQENIGDKADAGIQMKNDTKAPKPKRTRHRKQMKSSWPREITKNNREHGKGYLGYHKNENGAVIHGVHRPERQFGPRCKSNYCRKSTKRNCHDVDEKKRKAIFERFWEDLSWDQKKIYIASVVDVGGTATQSNVDSRRLASMKYFLKIDNKRVQVCKSFFMSSLGLNEWTIREWATSSTDGMIPAKAIVNARRKANRPPSAKWLADEEKKDFLKKFFDELPKMPSHYCRKRTDKKYVEPNFQSLAQLYRYYKMVCEESSKSTLSYGFFCDQFKDQKLGLYQPKNDRCDTCEAYDKGNGDVAEYNEHVLLKDRAREEKEKDKELALAGKIHAFVWDVQAVKLCPVCKASCLYYKLKLKVHNFSIYDLRSTKCMNNWWHEGEGGMDASMFTTCVIDFFEENCKDDLPIVVWSDGCGYQNRNQILSNALLDYAIRYKKNVQQKFLVKGHTQMEVDNVHALIENKLKDRTIDLPTDYIEVTKEARLTVPLQAKLLTHKDFRNYDDARLFRYNSIRPGKGTGDDTVQDLRLLNYSPTGTISFKVDFDQEMQPLPRKPKQPTLSYKNLDPLYTEELKITAKRYKDLQDLKVVLPSTSHSFYDKLLHEN